MGSPALILASLLAAAPGALPAADLPPGVTVAAHASVEIVRVASGGPVAGPGEVVRRVRRDRAGSRLVEFE